MIEVGKRLFTKDGRKVGNGIVVSKVEHKLSNVGDVWEVETDFGNTMKLTDRELEEFYYVGWEPEPGPYHHTIEEWRAARMKNIMGEEV